MYLYTRYGPKQTNLFNLRGKRMLDFESYTIAGEKNWLINRERTVIIRLGIPVIYKALGEGLATAVKNDSLVILQNIYVKKDMRGNGIFAKYFDDIHLHLAAHYISFALFPTPFEFSVCPFKHPKRAQVIPDHSNEKKERLVDRYIQLGLGPVKTAYFNKIGNDSLLCTQISGESVPRLADKGEYFLALSLPENFGGQFLGISNANLDLPHAMFYQSPEIHPDFL